MVERSREKGIRRIISRVIVAGTIAGAANLVELPPTEVSPGRGVRPLESPIGSVQASWSDNLGSTGPERGKEEAIDPSCCCCDGAILLPAVAVILKKLGLITVSDRVPPFYK